MAFPVPEAKVEENNQHDHKKVMEKPQKRLKRISMAAYDFHQDRKAVHEKSQRLSGLL